MSTDYDAILLVSFGGPEGMGDVMPFLENVLRGRNVPRERMLEVAHHYEQFDGISPINEQCREFLAALRPALDARGINLRLYWGNRNWHPLLPDTLEQMRADGVKRALAFVTAAYSSYSSCRQYRENIADAQTAVGEDIAPAIDKVRVFYNHPLFVAANVERACDALQQIPRDRLATTHLAFTAHSIPLAMANNCNYAQQLNETARLVAETLGFTPEQWKLVYQSRSGHPSVPWLAPDICEHLDTLTARGATDAVVVPIGFLSDHMEVIYDLDTEAQQRASELGLNLVRAATVGTHPLFIEMTCELIVERLQANPMQRAIGKWEANHDVCPVDCCLPGASARPAPQA